MTLISELDDELDPIMFINQVSFDRKHIVLLTTLHGTLCAFNLTDEVVVG